MDQGGTLKGKKRDEGPFIEISTESPALHSLMSSSHETFATCRLQAAGRYHGRERVDRSRRDFHCEAKRSI